MDEKASMESKLSSPAAFVEGGVQEACEDACSICLEDFCDSDPSTVTSCKHEYHLQCILEWCQRSSQCPMCWQPISLKDPMSQELLEAVEQERNMRANPSRSTAVFRHPMLGDFEVPVGADDAELEERIIQHLAAAAAIRRTHRHARREGHRGRTGAYGRPQVLVFSTNGATSGGSMSANSHQEGDSDHTPIISASPLAPLAAREEERQHGGLQLNLGHSDHVATAPSVNGAAFANSPGTSDNSQSTPVTQNRAGPSELQSFSDSLKSRLQSVSMRYKDSITKSTRGWKERWFSRSSTMSDLGSEVRREVNAGIAAVSRMMERLETRDSNAQSVTSSQTNVDSASDTSNQRVVSSNDANVVNDACSSASCVSRAGSQ